MSIIIGVVGLGIVAVMWYVRHYGGETDVAPQPQAAEAQATPSGQSRISVARSEGEDGGFSMNLQQYSGAVAEEELPATAPATTPAPAAGASKDDNTVAALVGVGEITDGRTIEPQALYYLLREVETKYPADNLFIKDAPLVTLDDLRKAPGAWRAKTLRLRGQLVRLENATLNENPSGIRNVQEGYVMVDNQGVAMFIASRPSAQRLFRPVELRGIFMKLVDYEDQAGRWSVAPLILVTQPVRPASLAMPAAAPSEKDGRIEMVVGVIALLFLVYFILMYFLRRKQASRNPALEARRKARALTGAGRKDDHDDEREITFHEDGSG
jgi:hypothetical protein